MFRNTGYYMDNETSLAFLMVRSKVKKPFSLTTYQKPKPVLCIERKQPDGSVKWEIGADVWQALALKLIEAIPQFPLEKG